MSDSFEPLCQLPRISDALPGLSIDLNKVLAIYSPYYAGNYIVPSIIITIQMDGKEKPIEYFHRVVFIEDSKDASILVLNTTSKTVYPKNWTMLDKDEEPFEMEEVRKLTNNLIREWRGF